MANKKLFCKLMKNINSIFHAIAALMFIGGIGAFVIGFGYGVFYTINPNLQSQFLNSYEALYYLVIALTSILFGMNYFFGSNIMKKTMEQENEKAQS